MSKSEKREERNTKRIQKYEKAGYEVTAADEYGMIYASKGEHKVLWQHSCINLSRVYPVKIQKVI